MEIKVKIWEQVLQIIRTKIDGESYKLWFTPIVPAQFDNSSILLEVPSAFFYEYVDSEYANIIRATLFEVTGHNIQLNYRVVVDHSNVEKGSYTLATNNTMPIQQPKVQQPHHNSNLNPRYTFENYIEGPTNRLARAAGISIAQNPRKATYNPLFIYGSSAIGKTHLANAIGIKITENFPELRVLYVTTNEFQIQFTEAVRLNQSNDFLNYYQSIDVLIIDDIQELIGKTKTLNTFFHIFNHLHQLGKQLIMCSDREPSKLSDIDERMLSRFKWGLIAKIDRPDYKLRQEILRGKIKDQGITLSDNIIDYIAKNVDSNVRDLEGTLVSILAKSTILNQDIDIELARQTIQEVIQKESEPAAVTIEKICNTVCQYYSIKIDDLLSKSRRRELTEPRQIAMYLARNHTNTPLKNIGETIGHRDHTTVLYACQNIKNQMDISPKLKNQVNSLEEQIYSH